MADNTPEIYSISFQTRKLGTLATGYTLKVAGEKYGMGIPEELADVCKNPMKLGMGEEINRDYEAKVEYYCDPLYARLDRVCFITNMDIDDVTGARVINRNKAIEIFRNSLINLDVSSFMNEFMNTDGITFNPPDISKEKYPNPSFVRSFLAVSNVLPIGNIVSTLDILASYLPVFGVEMYWNGKDQYSVEEPRMLHPENIVHTVPSEDILSMSIREDLYNIPDVVIPKFNIQQVLGKGHIEAIMANMAKNVSKAMEIAGTDEHVNFKVSTAEIPQVIVDAWIVGKMQEDDNIGLTTGILSTKFDHINESLGALYSRIAVSSAMYQIQSGTIRIIFNPKVSIPSSWYKIGEKNYFVSDISHEITRFRRETILTVVMTEDGAKKVTERLETIRSVFGTPEDNTEDKVREGSEDKVNSKDEEAKSKRKDAKSEKHFNPFIGRHSVSGSEKGRKRNLGAFFPRKSDKTKIEKSVASKRIPSE